MTTVYIQDVRKLGLCNHGLREFAAQHNLDWYDFVQNGIDAEVLIKLNDTNALQAVEIAKQREQGLEK